MANGTYDPMAAYDPYQSNRLSDVAGFDFGVQLEGYYEAEIRYNRTSGDWEVYTKGGGFTAGVPWIKVNPNYQRINAQNQVAGLIRIFSYYQRLIRLRKTYEIITEGTYELLDSGSNTVWAYQRVWNRERLLVLANLSDQELAVHWQKIRRLRVRF